MADGQKIHGTVTEILPNLLFRVLLNDKSGREKICYCSGKMKLAKIKLIIGDKVEVILDPYDGKGTNRIVWRLS